MKKMVCALLLLALLPMGGVDGVEKRVEKLSLSTPNLRIEKGERIMGFKVIIEHGRVDSVPHIPPAWGMDIDVDPAWKTVVTAHIVVGAAALTSEDNYFNDFLIIVNEGNKETPLNVEVQIIKSKDTIHETTEVFRMNDLKLQKR